MGRCGSHAHVVGFVHLLETPFSGSALSRAEDISAVKFMMVRDGGCRRGIACNLFATIH